MLFGYELFKFFQNSLMNSNFSVAKLRRNCSFKFKRVLCEEFLHQHILEISGMSLLFFGVEVDLAFSASGLSEFKNLNGRHVYSN